MAKAELLQGGHFAHVLKASIIETITPGAPPQIQLLQVLERYQMARGKGVKKALFIY